MNYKCSFNVIKFEISLFLVSDFFGFIFYMDYVDFFVVKMRLKVSLFKIYGFVVNVRLEVEVFKG